MVEMLKKSMYAAIGSALMAREKAEELGKKFAAEAKLSESDGKQFVDELLKRADETRSSFEKMVAQQIESALGKINIPTRKEVADIDLRLRRLEDASRTERA